MHDEVIRRRNHAVVANIIMGSFNVIAAISAHILYVYFDDLMISRPSGSDSSHLTFDVIVQDIFNWIFSDGIESSFISSVGEVIFPLAPFGWGYGCSMSYFLFLGLELTMMEDCKQPSQKFKDDTRPVKNLLLDNSILLI